MSAPWKEWRECVPCGYPGGSLPSSALPLLVESHELLRLLRVHSFPGRWNGQQPSHILRVAAIKTNKQTESRKGL